MAKSFAAIGRRLTSRWSNRKRTRISLQPLQIDDIGLVHDTGASDTDLSTSNPAISGSVSGFQGHGTIVIEVDHNGNGAIDGSVNASTGMFTYNPADLDEGWVELHVRARSNSTYQTSPWRSFAYVYHSDPDGPEAQALATAYASFLDSNQDAMDDHGDDLSAAQDALGGARTSADDDFDDAIDQAAQDRSEAMLDADQQYQQAHAAADADYTAAIQTAAVDYQTALANFGGDTTSFPFQPISWPDAPPADALRLPDPALQPVPPRERPAYSGPQFNFESDLGYQASIAQTRNTFELALQAANDARRAAAQQAADVYRQTARDASQQYWDTRRAIFEDYFEALQAEPATDLNAAREVYNQARQAASDDLFSAQVAAGNAYSSAIEPAEEALSSTLQAAADDYDAEVQPAWDALWDAVFSDPPAELQTQRSLYLAWRQTSYNAGKVRDIAVSTARRAYDETVGPVVREYNQSLANARAAYAEAIADAARDYDAAVLSRDDEFRQIRINATIAYRKALATAQRDRDWMVADAAQAARRDTRPEHQAAIAGYRNGADRALDRGSHGQAKCVGAVARCRANTVDRLSTRPRWKRNQLLSSFGHRAPGPHLRHRNGIRRLCQGARRGQPFTPT